MFLNKPTGYQFTSKYFCESCSEPLRGQEPRTRPDSGVRSLHTARKIQRDLSLLEPSSAPSCRVTNFLPALPEQRMEVDAVYSQNQFFKTATHILPRQRDEGSEATSCSSCQKLLWKGTGGSGSQCCRPFFPLFMLVPCSLCLPQRILAHKAHRQTQVQVLPVGSPLAPPPRPTGTHCRVKGIVFSIKKQKGRKNCGLKAQGKETGILYRLLNVQFKSW